MAQSTAADGRTLLIGTVVMLADDSDHVEHDIREGCLGVVIDAWPLHAPEGIRVRWEPLARGRVSTLRPGEVEEVPLADRDSRIQ